MIFGSIHGCSIKQNVLKPNGSTFTASRGDDFLVSGDKNFRPINLRWGPDGDIYLIDWHDQNPCHQAKPDNWDYEHGRVYRIQRKGTKTKKAEDLAKKSSRGAGRSCSPTTNPWWYRTALRLLARTAATSRDRAGGDRPAIRNVYATAARPLRRMRRRLALDAASTEWVLRQQQALASACEAARLRGSTTAARRPGLSDDRGYDGSELAECRAGAPKCGCNSPARRSALGEQDTSLPLLHNLMKHKEDANDPVIPLMIWLAYEPRSLGLGR